MSFNVTVFSGSLIVDKKGCLHGCGGSKTVIFSHYKNLSFKGDMLLNDAEIVKLI